MFEPAEIDRPVVADEADRPPLDRGVAADGRGSEGRLEVEIFRAVDQASDHLAHVIGFAVVDRNDPEKLIQIIKGRRGARTGGRNSPADAGKNFPADPQRVRVVLGEIFAEAGHRAMQLRSAEVLVAGDLAGRGSEQRRPREKNLRAAAHHDDIIGEARLIGAACGR